MIRHANENDLEEILRLEEACFETDRFPRRNLRHLLTRGHAYTLVDETGGRLNGYVLVLLRHGTSLARLYSIAVDPAARGRGIAAALVRAAVKAAGLIGYGLYGVDVKQCGERVVVIEVNDNPNLDAGVEDQYLGDELYRLLLEEFVHRMERRRSG